MDHPTIIIKRTKEDLRRYNLFTSIGRKPMRKYVQYFGPVIGIVMMVLFFLYDDSAYLAFGVFFIVYPFFTRYTIIKSSDISYRANNLEEFSLSITFTKDSFQTVTEEEPQVIKYSDIYRIYNRKTDLYIYINRLSGLYINKLAYDEETISQIITLLMEAIPTKIK